MKPGNPITRQISVRQQRNKLIHIEQFTKKLLIDKKFFFCWFLLNIVDTYMLETQHACSFENMKFTLSLLWCPSCEWKRLTYNELNNYEFTLFRFFFISNLSKLMFDLQLFEKFHFGERLTAAFFRGGGRGVINVFDVTFFFSLFQNDLQVRFISLTPTHKKFK